MKIFDFDDYKKAVKWSLNELKTRDRRANFRSLADACKVQKTYLSRVLNRDGHLNSDQLHLAIEYLGLTQKERKYVTLLHEAERSALRTRKDGLLREAKKIQAKAQNVETYTSGESLQRNSLESAQYYLDPTMQLVHLFLTIPKYAKNPGLIEEKLDLSRAELDHRLTKLCALKIISWDGDKYTVLKGLLYLSPDMEVYPFYRTLVRTKALEKLQKTVSKKDYSYSLYFSADENTRSFIQKKFLEFLITIEPAIKAAPETDVYQLGFDLLTWSEK